VSEHPGGGEQAGEVYSGGYSLFKGKATRLDRLSGLMDLINCRVVWAEVFARITNRGNRHSRKNKCSCGRNGIVMLKKILIGLAVIIVGLLVVVAVQPSQFQVTRTATISAPPPAVFD
jgi:hypothetical protein